MTLGLNTTVIAGSEATTQSRATSAMLDCFASLAMTKKMKANQK